MRLKQKAFKTSILKAFCGKGGGSSDEIETPLMGLLPPMEAPGGKGGGSSDEIETGSES